MTSVIHTVVLMRFSARGQVVGKKGHNLKTLDLLITMEMIKSHQGPCHVQYNKKIINILPTVKPAYCLDFECDVKCGSNFFQDVQRSIESYPNENLWDLKNLSFGALRTQCYISTFTIKHFKGFHFPAKTISKMIKPEIQPVSQFFYFYSTFGL